MRKYSKIAFLALFVNLTAFADNIQIQDVPNPNVNTGES
ncbi:type IV secretion system protein VirB9, partial [Campylobacter coli]